MPAADNVRVGAADYAGGVFRAPSGTTLPTDATSALNAAFLSRNVGLISDEGVTQSIGNTTTDIRSWQNNAIVRTLTSETKVSYQFTMLETASVALETYYDNFTAGASEITGQSGLRCSWVVQVTDEGNDIRIVIPDGQVTERGDTVFSSTDVLRYPVTITAYPDSSGNNAYCYVASEGS